MAMQKSHISVMLPRERRKLLQHLKAFDNVPSSQRIEQELERTGAWDRWERELEQAQRNYAERD